MSDREAVLLLDDGEAWSLGPVHLVVRRHEDGAVNLAEVLHVGSQREQTLGGGIDLHPDQVRWLVARLLEMTEAADAEVAP